jgi:pyrroloquinoline quinone biosynthesis protein E
MSEERPYTLVAELTYRCPLRCVYCSNPLEIGAQREELDAASWARVIGEAEALGVVQLNLTGGEPLLRADLEAIVASARGHGLYTNLITSGLPLERERLAALKGAGLDAVQLSLQDVARAPAARIAGVDRLDAKLQVAGWVRALALPLTLNVVLHRENLERVGALIDLAERLGADRLELANTQYLGWALENREHLLPTRAQLESAREVVRGARARLRGRMELLFVLPDYYADLPRACMDGWARRFIVVAPDGLALPCHAARGLPGLTFPDLRQRSLAHAWRESEAFQRFRGQDWMAEPCRSCERRELDFGGCRCQAFQLAGDPSRTDPACRLAPEHDLVRRARAAAEEYVPVGGLRYRKLQVLR